MLRYANWTRLATWSGKHDYRPEERGGSPVEKGARFRMTAASVGGLFRFVSLMRYELALSLSSPASITAPSTAAPTGGLVGEAAAVQAA
jgi:hypothetical protein